MSFGQLSVYRVMQTLPLDRWAETYLVSLVPIPAARTDDDIVAALTVVAQRHESLRSRFLDGPRGPGQVVSPTWHPELVHVELPGGGAEEATTAIRDTCRRPFDWDAGACWRAVVITDGGRPVVLGLIVDHIVSDGWGLRRVAAELRALLGSGSDRDEELLAAAPPQPQQLADFQRSDEWRRRRDATTRYWDGLLRDLPADVFPWSTEAGSVGRLGVVLRSARARYALGVAAHRLGASPHNVLLSLYAIAAREMLGLPDLALTLQAGNRSLPRWQGIVSSMNQYAPVPVVGAPVGGDFARLTETVSKMSLRAYWHGMYDLDSVREQVFRARGVELDFDCFFNWQAFDVRQDAGTGPPPDERQAVVERVHPSRQVGPRLDLKVQGGDGLSITVRVDPSLLSAERLDHLVRWFDHELWTIATSTECDTEQMTRRCARAVRG
ncbi:condensation domain-containing protein [Micromonospora tarensis]|uniref:Condensation domain-containing protein n=1 Tax=Micromonospora tarensis TaxID=2806100 RepID=A0ABS1YA55_9ACTN|nr:condensation domain-containing protein [Micromonospora tarensis]MBM0274281.1 hypothetical protein [Micromonospora tarensis]